ncbi:OB-fold domain-containing protein [Novosphingobium sp. G106]|uniref:Zn-ribbon domain-containing OB-fold protein n=1 Tax=Novosphingobium sp. G106 TaxID=2849500 RepID=UPI001C2DE95B|nr:OB-fold domain-containing protein [Novosphingobium sp. G106]MBV1686193.1 OB-fold domain-containing protein [Novosphingobium sp. G106]
MTADSMVAPKPGSSVIRIGAGGRPSIEGFRCGDCGAVVTEQTMACRSCASRTAPEAFRAANTGKVHSWSVVHRSYPGIAVPFVSAIVDLDDGLTLKGTLRGVDPAAVRQGMPVGLVFDDAGGARDKEGVPYVGFHFVPQGDVQ